MCSGCESWTLTKEMEESLNGCYTKMLRTALPVNWTEHMSNHELYSGLPNVSDKIASRRLELSI